MSDLLRQFQLLLHDPLHESGSSIAALLRLMAPSSAELLQLCAIPHEFDVMVLRVLSPPLDEVSARARLDEFAQLSCVVTVPDGLALHDATRKELFAQWLKPDRQGEFQSASARLATYYEGVQSDARGAAHETAAHSWMFHLLGADPEHGFREFESLCRRARHDGRWTACANLIRLVHEYDPVLTLTQAAWLSYHEGKLAIDVGQWERALELLSPLVRDSDVPPALAIRAALRLGDLAAQQGSHDVAIGHYQFAKGLVDSQHQATFAVHGVLRSLGEAHRDLGQYDRAKDLLDESLDRARQADDEGSIADIYNSLGTLHWKRRDIKEAADAYHTSLEILVRLGRPMQCAQVHNNLGMVYAEQRDWARAEDFYTKSLEIKRQVGDSLGQARTLVNLVQVHRGRGQPGAAIESTTQAIQLFASVRHTIGVARGHRMLGRLYEQVGASGDARAALQQAFDLFSRASARAEARETKRELAALGRKERLPWWAWLVIVFWALVLAGLVLVLLVWIALE